MNDVTDAEDHTQKLERMTRELYRQLSAASSYALSTNKHALVMHLGTVGIGVHDISDQLQDLTRRASAVNQHLNHAWNAAGYLVQETREFVNLRSGAPHTEDEQPQATEPEPEGTPSAEAETEAPGSAGDSSDT